MGVAGEKVPVFVRRCGVRGGVGDGTGMKQPRWITGARIVSSRGFADPKSISEKQMYFLSGRKIDDFAEF